MTDNGGSGLWSRHYIRFRTAGLSGKFGPWNLPLNWENDALSKKVTNLVAGHTYCFSVIAFDHAGNQAWSPQRCTSTVADDGALDHGPAWTRKKSKNFWHGSALSTTRQGVALTVPNVRGDRLGVLATHCPTCGKVGIFLGAKRVGVVDLHSSKLRYQVLTILPHFAAATGQLGIYTLTKKKTVTVDGFVVSNK